MIRAINADFVPVWVDIRRQPYPDMPALRTIAETLALDAEGYVGDLVSYHFHVRSYLVSPDLQTLYNPEQGEAGLPEVGSRAYLAMLQDARERARADP